jgi:hypothetical protein
VLAGSTLVPIDYGGGPIGETNPNASFSMVKLGPDGAFDWGFVDPTIPFLPDAAAVAPSGDVWVAGRGDQNHIGVVKCDAAGNLLAPSPILFGNVGANLHPVDPVSLAVGVDGSVALTLEFTGSITLATPIPTAFTSIGANGDQLVIKLSPGGDPSWAVSLGALPANSAPGPVAIGPSGDVYLVKGNSLSASQLYKLSGADGSVVWQAPSTTTSASKYCALAVDASGDVYAALRDGLPSAQVAKLAASDGSIVWLESQPGALSVDCKQDHLGLNPDGSVVHAMQFGGSFSPTVDLGAGEFDSYDTPDVFLAAYLPANTLPVGQSRLGWAKHVPMILDSQFDSMGIDAVGHIVLAGRFSGSMQAGGRVLVNSTPELYTHYNAFATSIATPSPGSTDPEIGVIDDSASASLGTMPDDMLVQATGPDGAEVFFMPPTAVDDAHNGLNVACDPRPNTMFDFGLTPVTCTATDPFGRAVSAGFNVNVVDKVGPLFSGVPGPISADATGAGGAVITYTPPTAFDQVDGSRLVSCDPPPGSPFPIGETTVECTSSDDHHNDSSISLTVTVHDVGPPTLTLPGTIHAVPDQVTGALVSYSATASDPIDGALVPDCEPASGSRFPLGSTSVDCSVTDSRGLSASGSFDVEVQYSWSGVLPPIDPDGCSVFKLGSTVPVKFRLTGASARIKNALATLMLTKISPTPEPTRTVGNFRSDGSSGQYLFNLSTRGLSTGKWRLSIDLHDDAPRSVDISLR